MNRPRLMTGLGLLAVLGATASGLVCPRLQAHAATSVRTQHTQGTKSTATQAPREVSLNVNIYASGPKYVPAHFKLPANAIVHMKIVNHDGGADKVPVTFATVTGTLNGSEMVNGRRVTRLQANDVSHTFTVMQLHLNVPIPPSSTVEFSFKTPPKRTSLTWQCYVPCGDGAGGWGGAMSRMGEMRGTITIG